MIKEKITKAYSNALDIMFSPGSKLKMLKDTHAQTGTIMALVTAGIMILIGVIIYANVYSAMPSVNSTAANSTMASVTTTFYAAMSLVVIGILVMAAVFILNVVQSMGR